MSLEIGELRLTSLPLVVGKEEPTSGKSLSGMGRERATMLELMEGKIEG